MMDVLQNAVSGGVGDPRGACPIEQCQLRGLAINGQVRRRIFERGARIETSGGTEFRVAIVASGLAAATSVMLDGRRQIVCLHAPGDAICPLGPREAECWAEALTTTEICDVSLGSTSDIDALDNGHLRRLFEMAHARLERLALHAVLLGRMDGTERLCAFLYDMACRIGRIDGQHCSLGLPMSREDIADYLGLNADTVSRIFSRIRKAGLVRFSSPTQCEIDDLGRLAVRAQVRLAPVTGASHGSTGAGAPDAGCPFARLAERVR